MKYKGNIDNKIINYLFNKNESRNKLKEAIEEKSDDVFDCHIAKLMKTGIIARSPLNRVRGKKTIYYLTSFGKKQHKLKLLPADKESFIYQKIYQELFLCEFNTSLFFLYSEKDFQNFLQECNISNLLRWGKVETSKDSDYWELIYPKISYFHNKLKHKSCIEKFWIKEEYKKFVLCELKFPAPTIEISDQLINIEKIEHWQINRSGNHQKYSTTYSINLPGINHQELINNIQYKHQSIKKEQIEQGLKLLKENKIIKFLHIGKNVRIVINDKKLRNFIIIIQEVLHTMEMDLLLNKWYFFEKPTKQEEDRMKKLFGENEARIMFFNSEVIRAKEKKLILRSKDIYEYTEQLKISSGLHPKSRITNDPSMTEKEKELYKNMTIIELRDPLYTMVLDFDLQGYSENYIPSEISKLEKEIQLKQNQYDPSRSAFTKKSIENLNKKVKKLKNYKKNVKMYFKYRKLKWQYFNSEFARYIQEIKEEYKDIFTKYEYMLKPVFEVFFPSLAELEPRLYVIETENHPKLDRTAIKIKQKKLNYSKDNKNKVKTKISYFTQDGVKIPVLDLDSL